MTNKPIKEYEDFTGEAGYLIVDSLTNEISGGKLKVPNYKDVTDGYVLTKTSNADTDDVVWAAPQAGSSIPEPPSGFSDKNYVLGIGPDGNFKWVELGAYGYDPQPVPVKYVD